jgi:hypothetical protein
MAMALNCGLGLFAQLLDAYFPLQLTKKGKNGHALVFWPPWVSPPLIAIVLSPARFSCRNHHYNLQRDHMANILPAALSCLLLLLHMYRHNGKICLYVFG